MKKKIIFGLLCTVIFLVAPINNSSNKEQKANDFGQLMKEYKEAVLSYQKEMQSDVVKKKAKIKHRKRCRKKEDTFLAFASNEVFQKKQITKKRKLPVSRKKVATKARRKKSFKKTVLASTKKKQIKGCSVKKRLDFFSEAALEATSEIVAEMKEGETVREKRQSKAELNNFVSKKKIIAKSEKRPTIKLSKKKSCVIAKEISDYIPKTTLKTAIDTTAEIKKHKTVQEKKTSKARKKTVIAKVKKDSIIKPKEIKPFVVEKKESNIVSKEALKTAIEIAAEIRENKVFHEKKVLKAEFGDVISKKIDSASIDGIIRLLDLEIKMVKRLLSEKTGRDVSELLSKRQHLLNSATDFSVSTYKEIMEFATAANQAKKQSKQSKKIFLKGLKNILEQYRAEFGRKYHLACNGLDLPRQKIASSQNLGDVKTSINAFDVISEEPLELFSHNFDMGVKKKFKDNIGTLRANFSCLWTDIMNEMNKKEITALLEDVLSLIKYEARDFIAGKEKNYNADLMTNVDTGPVITSDRAQDLFESLRDSAVLNTMKLGKWDSDLYKKNLNVYANKLKGFKDKCAQLFLGKTLDGFKNNEGSNVGCKMIMIFQ